MTHGRESALVITFAETTQAMAAERLLDGRKLPGRLIPTPTKITAGCGLSWRAQPEAGEALLAALQSAGIAWEKAVVLE